MTFWSLSAKMPLLSLFANMSARIPIIALVGRTNVGKSTLFNKLIEEQKSLISDVAGTTRDRFEADCIWRGRVVRLVDTGGLDVNADDPIERGVIEQTEFAIKEADVVLFLVDVTVGPTPDDALIAKRLMAANKPVIVVGNKADNAALRHTVEGVTWRNWPLARPMAISAARGMGAGDLLDAVYVELERIGVEPIDVAKTRPMRVIVFGEPNVGKSTLLNSLLGEKRFITSEVAHTTRQPNDVHVHWEGKDYVFVDTAGVRRQAKRMAGGTELEKFGVKKTIEMLREVDVALFILDISAKITSQDKHLAGVLVEHGVSVVIVANKWDLIPDKDTNTINKYEEYVRAHLPQLDYAPIAFISALTGKRVREIMQVIEDVFTSRFTELSGEECKKFISQAIVKHKPSKLRGTWHPRIISFEQYRSNPPTFALTINQPREDALAPSYVKFLEKRLRDLYEFEGTPIRINVRAIQKRHSEARQ